MTDTKNVNELENLIRLAHVVARPYLIAVWVLSLLLLLSVGANIYLATIENEFIIDADADHYSVVTQDVKR